MKKLLLLILCLLFLNTVHAIQPANISIATYEISNNRTTLLLDNGTAWTYRDTDLFTQPNGWQIGDQVQIVYVHSSGYHLQNTSYHGTIRVRLINPNSEAIQATRIQSIMNNDENKTRTLVLEDGTHWHIGSWSSCWMQQWQVGDRVLAAPHEFLFGQATHLIINFDRQMKFKLASNVRAQLLLEPNPKTYLEDLNQRQGNIWKLGLFDLWQDADQLVIQLNNKTQWRCSLPKQVWEMGDEIIISRDLQQFRIENITKKEEVLGTLINKDAKQLEVLVIQSLSKRGRKVVLQDGSIWLSSSRGDSQASWQVGDRVIVSPIGILLPDTSTHRLINLDKLSKTGDIPSYRNVTLIH